VNNSSGMKTQVSDCPEYDKNYCYNIKYISHNKYFLNFNGKRFQLKSSVDKSRNTLTILLILVAKIANALNMNTIFFILIFRTEFSF
jgi:hypothetical protein